MSKLPIRLTLSLILGSSLLLQGAINPAEFVKGASEKIRIEIRASHVESEDGLSRVALMAKVMEVEESASGLKQGDDILIVFQQDHVQYEKDQKAMEEKTRSGWVGPQILYYPPALSTGEVALAHLALLKASSTSGATYEPVGHQYAFRKIE